MISCVPSGPAALLDDYAQRLERTLNQSTPSMTPPVPKAWPRPREIGQQPADIRLSNAQTLILLGCGMTNRLAERNSTLAKVQAASQRLQPEWASIQDLQTCVQELEEDEVLQIRDLLASKQNNWPRYVLQASLGSQEMREFFGFRALRRSYPQAGRQALEQLRVVVAEALDGRPPNAPELEAILHTLAESQAGGAVLGQQAQLIAGLQRSNQALARYLAQQPLCKPGLRPQRAEVMQAIFRKFYLGRVQPLWSELSRTKATMNEDLEALFQALQPVLGAEALAYHQQFWQPGNAWDQQLSAVAAEHVKLWQTALRQCGMLPGQEAAQPGP